MRAMSSITDIIMFFFTNAEAANRVAIKSDFNRAPNSRGGDQM
jgi:hypothetical protein